MIGIISFSTFTDNVNSNIFIASATNIKSSYQGLNLSKHLYKKLGAILNENHSIFISDNYTEAGFKRLSQFKLSLNDKFKNCLFIETAPNSQSLLDENTPPSFLSTISEKFTLNHLCNIALKNNIPIIKKCYFDMIYQIKQDAKSKNDDISFSYKKNAYLEELNNKIKNKISNKSKKHNSRKLKM